MPERLEELCRAAAFHGAAIALPAGGVLFVNVDARFADLPVAPSGARWPASRTVIEISETSPAFDRTETLQALGRAWRAEGYRVAITEFGSAFAGEAAVLAVQADIVKVDRRVVRGIGRDRWRQEIFSATLQICSDLGCPVIAEGLETPDELRELLERGAAYGQGFLLGQPAHRVAVDALPPALGAGGVPETMRHAPRLEWAAGDTGGAAEAPLPATRLVEDAGTPPAIEGGAGAGPESDLAHHLFWRKEIARWISSWQGGATFAEVAARFVRSLPFRVVGIWRPEPERNRCVAIAAKGYAGANSHDLAVSLRPPQSLAAQAYERRTTVGWPGATHDERIREFADVERAVAIPLMFAGDVKGVLTIGDDSVARLPAAAIIAIEEIAPLLGALMANQELLESLRRSEAIFRWMRSGAPIAPATTATWSARGSRCRRRPPSGGSARAGTASRTCAAGPS